MRSSTRRSLAPQGAELRLPPEQSWHDHAVALLHIAAEIEHSLMVQYLYAAYSLGGAELHSDAHEQAREWREVILGIAKEEMGHLITVQNILRLIGGPLHLDREAYPFKSGVYPFPFALEPLTKDVLAKYVVAESSVEWQKSKEGEAIVKRATKADRDRPITAVGTLYEELIALFRNRGALRDDDFRTDVAPYEASWDEWGRGYRGGERGNLAGQEKQAAPRVLVLPTTDRASTIDALQRIARQGEAPEPDAGGFKGSHFARFLRVYEQFPERNPPSRDIPTNPTTDRTEHDDHASRKPPVLRCSCITHPKSLLWASLFNIRYRKLLYTLKHAFHVAPGEVVNRPTARGNLIAWTFTEMYNLRSIAAILVTMPLKKEGGDERAAPPFELPYSLTLPDWDSDKWRVHRDLYEASANVIEMLLDDGDGHDDYLHALADRDRQDGEVVERLFRSELSQDENA